MNHLKKISQWGAVFLLISTLVLPQNNLLQSGPMVGYSEMMEVMVWVQTTGGAKVKIEYWEEGQRRPSYESDEVTTTKDQAYTARLIADKVLPGKKYNYAVRINNKAVKLPYPLAFQSQKLWQWREDPPPFKLVIGSCAYVNDTPHDRPGNPYGAEYQIFDHIYQQQPDLMIWLGDNTYLREVDWYSRTGIFYRYTHTRSLPEMQPLLGSTHHYAIWDDHDFGPNNSDRSFRMKDVTLEAFGLFWGNPSYGLPDSKGVTTMFQWADIDFFLLDNRYHRTPNRRRDGKQTILGEAQIEWLIDALSASRAPFKMVAMGGQFLNSMDDHETYATRSAERERILDAIMLNDIRGVFFLTGDRHHTELSMIKRYQEYPVYDLTVSPLTAGPNPRAANEANSLRIEDTFVGDRNFGVLEFSGERTDRQVDITIIDKDNNTRWTRTIKAAELRRQ